MKFFIDSGLSLLPKKMDTTAARAMLYAIAFQESNFIDRKQILDTEEPGSIRFGPARSFWQFEPVGIRGVLYHHSTKELAAKVAKDLQLNNEAFIMEAIGWCDALASAYARLNLWKLPDPLPGRWQEDKGWDQYLRAWAPGKPNLAKWPASFKQGWKTAIEEKRNARKI